MPARISLAGPQSDVQGRMATATTGTGTLTLGSASANATTFAGMPVPINDGDTLTYELVDIGVSPPGKEKGRGTYHSAGPTLSRDSVIWSTNGNAKLNLSGNAFAFVTADEGDVVLVGQARTLLTAATTYYIATNGSDANDGKTPATAWQTFAHAAAVLSGQIDFGGQTVTLQAVAGHAAFTSQLKIMPWIGGGALIFDGGGGSIATTGADAILITGGALPGNFTYQNVTLSTSGSGFCVHHQVGGIVNNGAGVTFNSAASAHFFTEGGTGAELFLTNGYTVAGGAPNLMIVGASLIKGDATAITVGLSGNPQFPGGFIFVNLGSAFLSAVTYGGAASGYPPGSVTNNGILSRGGRPLPTENTSTNPVLTSFGGQHS
jgi:hypothetical protein